MLVACASNEGNKWGWPSSKYDTVVGYQFVNYGYTTSSPLADVKGRLALARLNEVKRKEALLSNSQIERLLEAMFIPDTEPTQHAVCYDPHHIFVFYSRSKAVAAFEVCFRCLNSNKRPSAGRKTNVNYSMLAGLCLELGLGTDSPPDQEAAARKFYRENKPPTD